LHRARPGDLCWPQGDRFILSKGHGAPVLYAVLALRDTFGISGNPKHLLKHYGLTAADVAAAARQVLARK